LLIPIQAHANRIDAKVAPASDRGACLAWLNCVGVVPGGAFVDFVAVGLLTAPPSEV